MTALEGLVELPRRHHRGAGVKGSFCTPLEVGPTRPLGPSTCGSQHKHNLDGVLGKVDAEL
jgi:hypothetical protein